ncbi:MAG: amidohydrolase family protein [Verrucomicrobia bacterium]|nr:amidohydrolase family protein [Verrucomicrobiota bacterium]
MKAPRQQARVHGPETKDQRPRALRWEHAPGNKLGDPKHCIARRDFFRFASGLAVLVGVRSGLSVSSADSSHRPGALVDVNVSISHWPTRRVEFDEAPELAKLLRSRGVSQAWVGSLDGMLHKDIAAANARLARACAQNGRGLLLPFGTINPVLPDWREELRRCAEAHRMHGIRLYPNYHGYKLDDPASASLLRAAAERGLIVQIALAMEDERMMHPLMRVAPVDPTPLVRLVREIQGIRLVLINALRLVRGEPLGQLIRSGEVYVEISTLDGVGCVERLVTEIPVERVLFGSNAPLFYFESAALKLRESSLSPTQLAALCAGNAIRLMPRGVGRGSRTP